MAMRPVLDISVRNPLSGTFTTYEIAIQTSNPAFSSPCSRTRRRYSEFCWLRKMLKMHHPLTRPIELPPKRLFAEKFDIQFLVQRMSELEDWLYSIVSVSLYLSDTALHLFLQTNLSCGQIGDYLSGKLTETVVEKSRRDCSVDSESFPYIDRKEDNDKKDNEKRSNKSVCFITEKRRVMPPDEADSGFTASPSESESESCSDSLTSGSPLTVYPKLTTVTEMGTVHAGSICRQGTGENLIMFCDNGDSVSCCSSGKSCDKCEDDWTIISCLNTEEVTIGENNIDNPESTMCDWTSVRDSASSEQQLSKQKAPGQPYTKRVLSHEQNYPVDSCERNVQIQFSINTV